MRRHLGLLALSVVVIASAATAQQPTPQAPQPATGAAPELPSPPANFQYSSDGRRDPFLSLVNRGTDGRNQQAAKRPDGVGGIMTGELSVRGIVQRRGAWAAMVSGPSGKVFTVRAGDRLADGVVRAVTAQAVIILQEVNDPLSLEKQREVRKLLRGGEEVK